MKTLPKVPISQHDFERLQDMARSVLEGARLTLPDGTAALCPDGEGRYRGVWLRDYCYAAEAAGDLVPAEQLLAVADLFLSHQQSDGSIPTRVMADGIPDFFEGPREEPIGSAPPTDNPQFLAKLVCAYVERTGDFRALRDRVDAVEQALASLPTDRHGLILIDPNLPRSSYGFTDCIAKTGNELFTSILRWEACRRLAETCRRWEMHEDAHYWYEQAEPLLPAIRGMFVPAWQMFAAATKDCHQIDVWGSAYACVLRAASSSQSNAVANWLRANLDRIYWRGYIRHLPAPDHWQRLLKPVPPDTYQNGGYWAVPTGWVAQTLATADPILARTIILQAIDEFEAAGIMEWIHPDTGRHCAGYVASVCNVLAAVIPSRRVAADAPRQSTPPEARK